MAEAPTHAQPTRTEIPEGDRADELARQLEHESARDVIAWAIERFSPALAISTALQVGGVVLIDMAYAIDPQIRVLSVDTGRLSEESYELVERLRARYPALELELIAPEADQVQQMVAREGPNLFYRSLGNRLHCCDVRKVAPLRRHLGKGLDAWITGRRRDQSATRATIRKLEIDHVNGGIVKLNPLADWTDAEVWTYAHEHDVPTHPLYERGYTSIGCAPCTRPTAPGEDERAGRWWWEANTPKECGLHGRAPTARRDELLCNKAIPDRMATLGAP